MTNTILIADDDLGVRTLLRNLLEPEGYAIIEAQSGEQALALANELHIDAFLLDFEMPRMNGIVVCRALRAMAQYQSAPIIFVTGSGDERVLSDAFAEGADDFLTKPLSCVGVR